MSIFFSPRFIFALTMTAALPVFSGHTLASNAQPMSQDTSRAASLKSAAQDHLFKQYPHLKTHSDIQTQVTYSKTNRLGLTVVAFEQSYAGISVHQKKASVLVKADGSISSSNSDLAQNTPLVMFADASALRAQARDAVKLAFAELGHEVNTVSGADALTVKLVSTHGQLQFESDEVTLKQVWYELLGELIPAFTFTLAFENTVSHEHIDHGFIVASQQVGDGPRILEHGSLHAHAAHDYTVFGGDTGDLLTANTYGASPRFYPLIGRPDFRVDAFPYQPPSVHNRTFGSISTSDPWLSPVRGAAYGTSGNHLNVCIQTPLGQPAATAENCGVEGWESVPYSSDRAFNWQYDPNNPLSYESRRASAVNIFYLYNELHDFFYDFGFDENAGNAQRDNYGRGGRQDDSLDVFVMDPSKFNNASARVGSDGASSTISMHPFLRQSRLFSRQFGITLSASVNEGLPNENSINEKLTGVAYSYLGQQVFEDVTAETIALEFDNDDGCNALLSAEDVAGKIAIYPIGECEVNDENTIIHSNMATLKEAGAVGIVFGVEGQKITEYQSTTPFSARFEDPLPHMFLSFDELFFEIFFDPFLCDDTGETCAPYMLTLESIDNAIVRDSALGHALSIHEWAHYLTVRLVGGTLGSGRQYHALLEGWADFMAVFFMMQPQDRNVSGNENWGGIYSLSDWAIGRTFTGLRRVPYTSDFTRNALTVENISNNAPLSAAALGHTVILNGNPNTEAHNAGEIWATVLLEAYVALLNDTPRLTFEQAQTRMMSYVITSMQMLNTSINFADARNAFLSVAYAHDAEDYDVLKRAFARRGMGVNFTSPRSFSRTFTPVENSFDVDIRTLETFSTGFTTGANFQSVSDFQAGLDERENINLASFQAQVNAALPTCARIEDVRYGAILAGYGSAGDLDLDTFDILLNETSGNHLLFDNNGKITLDGLRYDDSINVVIPFAYLASAENVIANVHVSLRAQQGVNLPEPSIYNLSLSENEDAIAQSSPVDCQIGRELQGVSQTDAASIALGENVFAFFNSAGREEQTLVITVNNTSDKRQNFDLTNQVLNQMKGIEIRHPRALHVPAHSSRTFELRAISRAKQLPVGRSSVDGAIELKSELSTLVVPYSVVSIKQP